ncbi:MAG: hypothetical protein NZ585_11660 [Chloracidobacterium sp.]|nr:hypothetical protein [Chloracidobacterium sp.]MDW8218275.1 hypothetical protein [Acidobacteriota bacterium]
MYDKHRTGTLRSLTVAALAGLFFLTLAEDTSAQHLYQQVSAGHPPSTQRMTLNVAHPNESPFRIESATLEVVSGQMCLLTAKLTNLGPGNIDRVGLVFSDGQTYVGGIGLALSLPPQGQSEVMALLSKSMVQLTSRVANNQSLTVLPANAFYESRAVYVLPAEQISRYATARFLTSSSQPCPPNQEARGVLEEKTPKGREDLSSRCQMS